MTKISIEKERWEKETVAKSLERLPERGEFFTSSDIPVKRLYTPADIANINYFRDLGFPGDYPFTRGVYPTMYRARLWTMRQY
ncbi:methylmalonyl-CoA mutase, partial [Candidatus Bathyarchaeota archaeon]|nr:methylmalonyl-CoA mutase [Candidatus Bathyarchaeota archaeon]